MSEGMEAASSTAVKAASRMMHRARKTKVVATLGPASSSRATIRRLVEVGADVFRLNFSHGTHEGHGANVAHIRALEDELQRPIAIIADLQGPKLRIGDFAEGSIALEVGQQLRLDLDPTPGDGTRVNLPHPEVLDVLDIGDDVLLDDGRVRLEITDKGGSGDGAFLQARVTAGTKLSNHKGFNIPGVALPVSALTDKDRRDLAYALDQGVDWVALSFVQRPEDVAEARRLIAGRAAVIVKLEKPQALDRLEEIVDLADGLMVARGDLGVEMPPERVPGIQKHLVRTLRSVGKPVIVATQMLESMVSAPAPTRAEASDVATAVYDGTDAVMLSAESASGDYPVEAVTMMDRILREVERDRLYRPIMDADHPDTQHTSADAISAAAHQVAHAIEAAAIATYTISGSTTLRAVRQRPEVPILCLTSSDRTARRLMLSYGVHSVHHELVGSFEEISENATRIARELGFAEPGQRIVITAGVPLGTPGSTNILRIAWVPG